MGIKTISANRAPGRPRSQKCYQAIMNATIKLLEDTTVRDLTIEAIAAEAKVGKTTIYRWWCCKTALVVDAFLEYMIPRAHFPESDSAIEALEQQVKQVIDVYNGKIGRIVAEIIAEGQFEPEILASFRERFLSGRRAAATEVIERGKQNGEFPDDLDVELAIDLIYGPIYYRLLVGHIPLNETFANSLLKQAINGLKRSIETQ